MRRRLLGIIAFSLIIGGLLGLSFGRGDAVTFLASSCVKSGCVLAALWLAFPQIADLTSRFPPWLLGAVVIGGLTVVIRPRYAVLVIPLLTVLFLMHGAGLLLAPRKSRRTVPRRSNPPQRKP